VCLVICISPQQRSTTTATMPPRQQPRVRPAPFRRIPRRRTVLIRWQPLLIQPFVLLLHLLCPRRLPGFARVEVQLARGELLPGGLCGALGVAFGADSVREGVSWAGGDGMRRDETYLPPTTAAPLRIRARARPAIGLVCVYMCVYVCGRWTGVI